MKKVFSYLAASLVCFLPGLLWGQSTVECDQDLEKMYAKKEQIDFSKGYYVKYGVQTVYKDKKMSSKEAVFTLIYKNNQIHLLGDPVSTYSDTNCVITVSSITKKIMINANTKKEFDRAMKKSVQHTDSLIKRDFTLLSCEPVSGHKEYDHQLVFKANKSSNAISQITYWYTKETSTLYKVSNKYSKSSPMDVLSYTFYKIDYDYKGSAIKSDKVYNLFFDSKGKLLPAYKNYKIIDQRNKKKK